MHSSKEYCAFITLEVRNAFNSACWSHIIQALRTIKTPAHLMRIISSYISERIQLYDTDEGVKQYEVTNGVPQDSVLSPIARVVQKFDYADDISVTFALN